MDAIGDLIAAFESLTAQLAALITDSPITYLVVFALVALDVLFPILPGEASVLIAAVLAGSGQLSITWVIVAAVLGAFVGDNVAYWIGRGAGRPLVERIMRGRPEQLDEVAARFADRGGSIIIIGRFVPGGRTAVAIGAGVLCFPWLRFVAYDAVAAVVWGLEAAIPGYIGGTVFADRPWIGLLVGIATGAAITLVVEAIRRMSARRKATEKATREAVDSGASTPGRAPEMAPTSRTRPRNQTGSRPRRSRPRRRRSPTGGCSRRAGAPPRARGACRRPTRRRSRGGARPPCASRVARR